MKTHSMTELREIALSEYPNGEWLEPADGRYVVLTEDGWLELLSDFHAWIDSLGLTYTADKGDCDKFAWLFRAYLIIRNWRTDGSPAAIAGLYGHYTDDQLGRHAIVFPFIVRGGRLVIRSLEPQPGGLQIVRRSKTERETVTNLQG
jgi:hypothetical protein